MNRIPARIHGLALGVALLCGVGLTGPVSAQVARDPTVAPLPAVGASGAVQPEKDYGALTVIVRDGRPLLVVGTRVYRQGQMLGNARIERISETEIWLREGQLLLKLPDIPACSAGRRAARCGIGLYCGAQAGAQQQGHEQIRGRRLCDNKTLSPDCHET